MHFILRRFVSLDNAVLSKIEKKCNNIEEKTQFISTPFNNKDEFFENISIITHAGGGMQGQSYLNCKEAFPFYYKEGNRVFEYDIDLSSDGKFICAHTEKEITEKNHLNRKIDSRFSPISIDECLELIKSNKDIKVIFDCKFINLTPFATYIKNSLVSENDLSRIVIQIFNLENINQVRSVWDFKMLYVCMQNTDYSDAVEICLNNDIHAVSVPLNATYDRSGWKLFEKANICSFVYTVNTVDEYSKIRSKGLTGAFSDFLFEKDVLNLRND